MAGETVITVVGNLVDDPELRFTPSGAAVANFRIASTPRTFDRQTNEWKDGDALFLSCSVWRQAAENVAESLQKGMRVVVQGRLKSRQYETREGEKRTVFEIEVDEVGPSLKYATAKVTRATRSGGGGGGGTAATRAAAGSQGGQGAPAQRRPVGTPAATGRRRPGWRRRPAAARCRQATRGVPRASAAATNRLSESQSEPTQPFRPHSTDEGRALRRSTTMAKPVIRKPKKKVCQFCKEKATGVDYKDTALLRKFISDRGKIRARRVTGNCVQHQRDVAIAVKNAREVALLPYTATGR